MRLLVVAALIITFFVLFQNIIFSYLLCHYYLNFHWVLHFLVYLHVALVLQGFPERCNFNHFLNHNIGVVREINSKWTATFAGYYLGHSNAEHRHRGRSDPGTKEAEPVLLGSSICTCHKRKKTAWYR